MSSWIRYHLLACLVCSFKFGTNTTKHFTFLPIGDILKFSTRLGKVDMPPMTKYWALQSYLMTSWLWITWAGLHFIYLIPWSFHLPDQPCSADLDLLICVNTWGSNLLAQTTTCDSCFERNYKSMSSNYLVMYISGREKMWWMIWMYTNLCFILRVNLIGGGERAGSPPWGSTSVYSIKHVFSTVVHRYCT